MVDPEQNKVDKRCPVCLARQNDVLLLHDGQGHYRCVRCSFTGQAGEIHAMYFDQQKKYHGIARRLTLAQQLEM
jgi:hypothetical protein